MTFIKKIPSPSPPNKLIVSGTTLYAACAFKLEVFSGASTGNLSLVQTVVTDQKSSDYEPFSMAFAYANTWPEPGKLYVLGTTTGAGPSELQTYSIAANGTLTLKTVLDQFAGQGAIATLSNANRLGYDLIGVTNFNNTLSIVKDDGTTQTVVKNLKLGTPNVAILTGLQSDQTWNFYVADQASKTVAQVELPDYDPTKATVIKTISAGTTPTYFGTDSHPNSIPSTGLFTANAQLGTISTYIPNDGYSESDFTRVSGGEPEAGTDVTSVNGLVIGTGKGLEAFVYSTNKSGTLRSYSGPGNGLLIHNNDYDTQGTGVSDVAITKEIETTTGGMTGGGGSGTGPFVEYFDGAYLAGSSTISVNDSHASNETVSLGTLTDPFQLKGETSTTITANTSAGTKITSGTETYSSANRYLVLVAADKFGSSLDTYAYPKNAYPTSANEWMVIFNGIPDFISGMDFYVLGPGKTLQNSTPVASNVNPGVGAFVTIPSGLGKFTLVATYAGGKSATDVISTSAIQTSTGGASIVADLADVSDVYSFVFAAEKQSGAKVESTIASSPTSRIRRR